MEELVKSQKQFETKPDFLRNRQNELIVIVEIVLYVEINEKR